MYINDPVSKFKYTRYMYNDDPLRQPANQGHK